MAIRRIVIGLVAVVVLYSAGWYGYGCYIETKLKNFFSAQDVSEPKTISGITYDKMSLEGFPFNITIRLSKLKAHLNYGGLLKSINGNSSVPQAKDLADMAMQGDYSADGDILLEMNLPNTSYTIISLGDGHYRNTVAGKTYNLVSKASDTILTIKLKHSILLHNKDYSNNDFLMVEGYADNFDLVDEETKALLSHADEAYSLIDAHNADKGKMEIKLIVKNNEVTKAFDNKLNEIFSLSGAKGIFGSPSFNLSDAGKSNINIELKYSGNLEQFIPGQTVPKVAVDISKFNFSNDLSSHQLSGAINSDSNIFKFVLHGTSKFEEKWYNDKISQIEKAGVAPAAPQANNPATAPNMQAGMAALMYNKNSPQAAEMLKKISENANVLIPKLYQFGTIKYDFDITTTTDDRAGAKLDIKQFDIISALYGVKISGHAENKQPQPEADLVISLINYPDAINDTLAYYDRITPAIKNITGEPPKFEIKTGFSDALRKLVQGISDTPNVAAKDAKITVVFDSKHPQPQIGTVGLLQAMMLVSTYITPYISEPAQAQGAAMPQSPVPHRPIMPTR